MGIYQHEPERFVTKKALSCDNEDLRGLGIEHTLLNINLPALMWQEPPADAIPFESGGNKFWFDAGAVREVDRWLLTAWQYEIAATAILLNAPERFGSHGEEALLNRVLHPDFDREDENAFISAFSMETEDGRSYYRAFVEFLSCRYMRDDAKYGRITGFIVSNEVNSGCIWGNAGEKTVEQYCSEYTKALRITWEASRKYWEHAQVFLSLDHCWGERFYEDRPLGTYRGRDVVDLVSRFAKEGGDFGWGIAYHPYPEDLHYPDFYNDRTATFYFDTKKITFKNIEVLCAYLKQEEFLYHGKCRPVILSEQGFHAGDDALTEKQGAAAYILAYQKVKRLPGILWMTHHAYLDNPKEFGLSLGIRERNPDGTPGRKRPVYEAMLAMGTEQEEERTLWAKAFIGEELYEKLLSPAVHTCDEDKSKEMDF